MAICCPDCVEVCVCLGWKSGAGTINISALSFTPWGGAIVTPRLKKQTGRPFSPLTSAVTNCKLYLFFSLFFFFFIAFLCLSCQSFTTSVFLIEQTLMLKRGQYLYLLMVCKKCD